jgi:hypothetical protein
MIEGLPSTTLIAVCSNPDDFVNNSTGFGFAPNADREITNPAPTAAEVRKKSRRVERDRIRSLPRCGYPQRPQIRRNSRASVLYASKM